uniref:Nucleolar protein 8 n=1 Tax=Mastacembelus armatus TaxID=205130 RepID=A0A3Q3KIW7_9TELE
FPVNRAMRRLYVGGLSHSITKKDLKDRFGKFGDVQDVEIRTRRDEDGVPYKTFGYININISDADLKKCFTVLNKSKWKGGTLQIETAKESFLHRRVGQKPSSPIMLQAKAGKCVMFYTPEGPKRYILFV